MPEVQVTTDDVTAVMQANPAMALQVENRALKRIVGELQNEVALLKQELVLGNYSGIVAKGDAPEHLLDPLGQPAEKEKLNAESGA